MTIDEYNEQLSPESRPLAEALCKLLAKQVPQAESKVWHGHPVWFIAGNPVFGYSLKKAGLEVLFWSGQSFKKSGLRPIGKFQAAGCKVEGLGDVEGLANWLQEAIKIQWDYQNLPKTRSLSKLTKF
ncbi:MAG: hypothetical protein RL197_643 [Actinomycetota bacterium]